MMLGIGLSLCSTPVVGGAPPTAASLNYSQVDVLGGGASIVITGTNLAGASVTIGGTSATVTGTTSTTATFTAPAKAAGSYDVVATTGAGSATLAGALEYWAPSTETGCTLFCEAPNYSSSAGNGTWTARVGTSPTHATIAPPASSGAPNYTAVQQLTADTIGNLMMMASTPAGTCSWVLNPSSLPAPAAQPYNDASLFGDIGRGAIGASLSTSGFQFFGTDGSYKKSTTAITAGALHAAIGRFQSVSFIETSVDGSAFATNQTAIGTYAAQTTQNVSIGDNYNATAGFSGLMKAVVFHNTKVSDAFATKFYKWAQQRHGVT